MRSLMSFRAKRELLAQVVGRYGEAGHRQKSIILDEFVAATGYTRKHAIRLLTGPVGPVAAIRRPRARTYGVTVQEALGVAWAAANGVCGKRLVPFLPELVESLVRHGHLHLSEEERRQLLAMSPATADRILGPLRRADRPCGVSTTKAGGLLKQRVPVRTFADWDDARPGFMEADLVAHCGNSAEGAYLHTLVLTDIATAWTECLALRHRSQEAVLQALGHARRLLPFPLLGFDTDNGGEFLNAELVAYCAAEEITFTRGRVGKKNDQCFVEQKNGSIVRQVVGYDRFEGERAHRQLAELYRAVRLYVNFFQPSMKLREKRREGSAVRRTYDRAQTPFQRLLATNILSPETAERLGAIYRALDPVRLLRQVDTLQDALWRHAVTKSPASEVRAAGVARVPFDLNACGLSSESGGDIASIGAATGHRRYRRLKRPPVPHTWRTRPDPFAADWEEVCGWLAANPERTAKSLFLELQARYPGRYPNVQLRTLQRRVKEWRARTLLAFDEAWLQEEVLVGQALPRPLLAVAADMAGEKISLAKAGALQAEAAVAI